MKTKKKLHWTFALDRQLIQLAAASETMERAARIMERKPAVIAKRAKRLGLSFKTPEKLDPDGT